MAYDEAVAERLRVILLERRDIEEKRMFGGVAFMLDGNMLIGVNRDEIMARVGLEQFDDALERPHARVMDFTKRPMKGWITVEPDGFASDDDLRGWVDLCVRFVTTLPKK
ncbi:MAG: TfoX/Sxy family protein [Acidobacteriota bacterium]